MTYIMTFLIVAAAAVLWRIRGGLFKEYVPANKVWYAAFFGGLAWFFRVGTAEYALCAALACYAGYQAFGWGLYIGRLLGGGELKPNLTQYRECDLIDDLLYSAHITFKGNKIYLYQYPRLFGFCGTCLSGLILTFLMGLSVGSVGLMLSGLAMGVFYWLGGQLEKLYALGKQGWNWGEWLFGAYLGGMLVLWLG